MMISNSIFIFPSIFLNSTSLQSCFLPTIHLYSTKKDTSTTSNLLETRKASMRALTITTPVHEGTRFVCTRLMCMTAQQQSLNHLHSSPHGTEMGDEKTEIWMVHLYPAQPVVGLLHQRGDTLLGPIRCPDGGAEFVRHQPKDRQR
jgi:hypothetical protein